jgi:hypothetical protein
MRRPVVIRQRRSRRLRHAIRNRSRPLRRNREHLEAPHARTHRADRIDRAAVGVDRTHIHPVHHSHPVVHRSHPEGERQVAGLRLEVADNLPRAGEDDLPEVAADNHPGAGQIRHRVLCPNRREETRQKRSRYAIPVEFIRSATGECRFDGPEDFTGTL